ncbi:hypothetical protein Tco_0493368 [Tanacetum coccineum]
MTGEVQVVGCFFSFGAVMLLCVPFCGQAKLLAVRYLVKVSWNSKGNFELTWVWEDYLKDKYPRLIVWLVKPLVLTYESVVMYGLCVYMRYVDCVRVGNQSIERDRLIGIGLVMDLVKFLSFTFGGKEMTFVGSRKIRNSIDMYPCRVEERLTIKLVKGEEVLKIETAVTAKDGTITKFLRKFPEYKPTKKEEEISKLKAICENVIYDIFDSDSDLESTTRSGPRDSEMEDTGGGGIRVNA